MLSSFTQPRLRSPWTVFLGILCISLLLVGGLVSAAHNHVAATASHQDCGLCVSAHMAIQVAASVTQVLVCGVFTSVETVSPLPRRQFLPQFALFSRPPPADSNLS
jgi:hypothetical protein